MKNIIVGILVGLLIGGAVTWTLLRRSSAGEQGTGKPSAEPAEPSRVQHGTNGETFLKLDLATQEKMGMKLALLEAIQVAPKLKALGMCWTLPR